VLGETTFAHDRHTARLIIARYIIERALAGERDPTKLGEGALVALELMGNSIAGVIAGLSAAGVSFRESQDARQETC
jgi:hypothetical protein